MFRARLRVIYARQGKLFCFNNLELLPFFIFNAIEFIRKPELIFM